VLSLDLHFSETQKTLDFHITWKMRLEGLGLHLNLLIRSYVAATVSGLPTVNVNYDFIG
jgi:hypothetical protein